MIGARGKGLKPHASWIRRLLRFVEDIDAKAWQLSNQASVKRTAAHIK
jgi:hypothetical protein